MNKLQPETLELISDSEFERVLKYVAMDLGGDVTLADVKNAIELSKPLQIKNVNGVNYTPGYKGPYMVEPGIYDADLIEISHAGGVVKLMFAFLWESPDNIPPSFSNSAPPLRFLYWSCPKNDMAIEEVINISNKIGKRCSVTVSKGVIENTGEYHASVTEWIPLP